MKNIIWILVLSALGWYGWGKYEAHVGAERAAAAAVKPSAKTGPAKGAGQGVTFFTCDGRTTCMQMTSCEEAKYFIENCPGMNAEASREAPSCEKQWCK